MRGWKELQEKYVFLDSLEFLEYNSKVRTKIEREDYDSCEFLILETKCDKLCIYTYWFNLLPTVTPYTQPNCRA